MPGKHQLLVLIPGLLLRLSLPAQEPGELESQAERMVEANGISNLPEEIFLRQESLAHSPLDLNRSSVNELLSSGLFNSFQARMIQSHRDKYGTILSLNELVRLPGFNSSFLRQIRPFVSLEREASVRPAPGTDTRVTMGASRRWPEENESWPGNPWKYKARLGLDTERGWTAGLAYEKDPGERAITNGIPENLNAFLSYSGQGHIKKVVAGTYRLQCGLGLAYGSGMFHSPDTYMKQATRLSVIQPYAGMAESSLLKGLAIQMGTKTLSLMGYSSMQHVDLSLAGYNPEKDIPDWSEMIREGGIHRTEVQRTGRGLGILANAGLQLNYHHKSLTAGTHISFQSTGLSKTGRDSLGLDKSHSYRHTSGFHWQWYRGRLGTNGEILYQGGSALSLLGMLSCKFSNYVSGLLIVNSYGPMDGLPFTSTFNTGSGPEKGFALQIHLEPAKNFQTEFCVQYFRHLPWRSTSFPEEGYRFRALFSFNSNTGLGCRLVCQLKAREREWINERAGCRLLSEERQKRMDLQIHWRSEKLLEWKNRFILSSLTAVNSPGPDLSIASSSQLNYRLSTNLKIKAWFCLFQVPLWDNRIYLWEPGLYHEFAFPVLSGKGRKFTLISELKVGKMHTLEVRISGSGFPGTELEAATISTGAQLRFRF